MINASVFSTQVYNELTKIDTEHFFTALFIKGEEKMTKCIQIKSINRMYDEVTNIPIKTRGDVKKRIR